MRNHSFGKGSSAALVVATLAVAFPACGPRQPVSPPAPTPPPELSTPVEAAPPTADSVPATGAPSAAGAPRVAAAVPSAAAATLTTAPELSTMKLAAASSKLGVPVDLRYSFDAGVEPGRPVTLHLAAVPRVAGSNLSVSIKDDPGIQLVAAAPFGAQKATVATAYRQQLSVTKAAGGPPELRVLVTMEVGEGSAFSWFGVPLEPAAEVAAQK